MFSAYRQGLINPDCVSTQQPVPAPPSNPPDQQPSTSTGPKIPAAWLKPRSAFGKLASGSGQATPVSPVKATPSLAQKVAYDPKETNQKQV